MTFRDGVAAEGWGWIVDGRKEKGAGVNVDCVAWDQGVRAGAETGRVNRTEGATKALRCMLDRRIGVAVEEYRKTEGV